MDTAVLLTFAAVFLAAIYMFRPGQKKYNLPPYPWFCVPIIGNVIQLMRSKKNAYELFYETSKKPEYGKVFMIKIGGRDIAILNHIDVVKEATGKRAADFAGRPELFTADKMTDGGKDIAFGQYSPEWQFHRKVAHTAIRRFAGVEKLEEVVNNAVMQAVEQMEKQGDKPFVIKPFLELIVFNSICGVCFGKIYDFDDPEFKKFTGITQKGLEAFGSGTPADFFPWLSWMPFQHGAIQSLIDVFLGTIEREFYESKAKFNPKNLNSLIDHLLLAQREAEEEESGMAASLTDRHLILTIFDAFSAGIDTMNATLQNSIAFMIQHPELQEKLHNDVSIMGSAPAQLSDRQRMPYVEAFLMETLRTGLLTVLGVPLATTCDTFIDKYELPKGTMVLINFWGLHHDPDKWDKPTNFDPTRFLDEHGEISQRPDSYLPFSRGKRVCLGENLAKVKLMMMITRLVQQFKFVKPDSFKHEFMSAAIAIIPKSFDAIVQRRATTEE